MRNKSDYITTLMTFALFLLLFSHWSIRNVNVSAKQGSGE